MNFRHANRNDIESILKIVSYARRTLNEKSIEQWQGEYPAAADFERDILRNSAYVLEQDGEIIGMASLLIGTKKEYEEIDGTWLTKDVYAVIHRMGVAEGQTGKGISHRLLDELEQICIESDVFSIRVDTCFENNIMRGLIDSRGFTYCGITQGVGGIRNAYEKILDTEILSTV